MCQSILGGSRYFGGSAPTLDPCIRAQSATPALATAFCTCDALMAAFRASADMVFHISLLTKGIRWAAQLLGRRYLWDLSFSLSSDSFRRNDLLTIFASESTTASPGFSFSSTSLSSSSRRSSSEPAAENVSSLISPSESVCASGCSRPCVCGGCPQFLVFFFFCRCTSRGLVT